MAIIPNTRGNPQFSDIATQNALPLLGTASREDGQTVVDTIDSDLARLYEDRNITLTDGGTISFSGTSVSFTEALKLIVNSNIAGNPPIVIDLGSTTRNLSVDGRMVYAVIDRSLGTSVVTDDASSLPSAVSANKEVFLIAKRRDTGGAVKRIYFRDGTAFSELESGLLGVGPSGSGSGGGAIRLPINQTFGGDTPPLDDEIYEDLIVTPFNENFDEDIRFQFFVPNNYISGTQIFLNFSGFTETTGNLRLTCNSSLFRPGITDADADPSTNIYSNSQTIAVPGTITQFFSDDSLEITNASGQINSISIQAGDLITINFKREGTDVLDTVNSNLKLATLE